MKIVVVVISLQFLVLSKNELCMQMRISMVRESLQVSLKTFCMHKFYQNPIKWFLQYLHYVASAFRFRFDCQRSYGRRRVGRYVEYANLTPPLLNFCKIGAVFDSRPSGISKPYHKWESRGYGGYLQTIHWVCDPPFAALLQILLIGYYKSG